MAPKLIYVIRHCDKTDDKFDGCNDDGYNRAKLLVGLTGNCDFNVNKCNGNCTGTFTGGFWKTELKGEKPVAILAPISNNDKHDTKKMDKCSSSNRCCLVLNPTASYYQMKINSDGKYFCDDQGEEIANYILNNKNFDDGIVIVAWEHKNIPKLINTFNVNPKLPNWPKDSSNRFDLVFKIDPKQNTVTISSQNFNLPGDSLTNPFGLSQISELYTSNDNPNINNYQCNISIYIQIFIVLILIIVILIFIKLFLKI